MSGHTEVNIDVPTRTVKIAFMETPFSIKKTQFAMTFWQAKYIASEILRAEVAQEQQLVGVAATAPPEVPKA